MPFLSQKRVVYYNKFCSESFGMDLSTVLIIFFLIGIIEKLLKHIVEKLKILGYYK